MASGFSGGGNTYIPTATTSLASSPQPTYPSQNHFPVIFPQPSPHPPSLSLLGKRTLLDFQSQHHRQLQNQSPLNNLLFMRYVKPRIHHQLSPLHLLDFPADALSSSPDEFSLSSLSSPGARPTHGCGVPLLQQIGPQPISLRNGMLHPGTTVSTALPGVPFAKPLHNRVILPESENENENENGVMNRLQELEKQLLDDDDEVGDGNTASVVTNGNSEWSDTLQSLMVVTSQCQKQISSSPTSSSSSSSPSSSLSVASPVITCSKQTILEAASAIYEGKSDVAAEILARIMALPNPKGNWEQKLMDYVLYALKSRLSAAENSPLAAPELFSEEHALSTQMLYDLSPCFKLGFMAANLVILEAALEQPSTNKLHVIDFDVGQGGQYVNLLHALGTRRSNRPSILKITSISDDIGKERMRLDGDALNQQAAKAGISLQLKTVNHKLTDLNSETLGCEADEALVVNLAFKLYRMPDESVSEDNPRDFLLRRVKALSPRVMTLVEQECNVNTAPFLTRVNESFGYYGALLDSIESTVSKDHPDRVRVEEGLGRKLRNSIACEGRDRVERCEVFGKWKVRMGMAGFVPKPMDPQVAESMRARLANNGSRANPGFTVKEEAGGVGFGWQGRTLTVASAWR